jgi:DNA sulfur modification protein DndD
MKINRIVLNNFGSYENLNTFDFSECDHEKRVVVIGGKNGTGKKVEIISFL